MFPFFVASSVAFEELMHFQASNQYILSQVAGFLSLVLVLPQGTRQTGGQFAAERLIGVVFAAETGKNAAKHSLSYRRHSSKQEVLYFTFCCPNDTAVCSSFSLKFYLITVKKNKHLPLKNVALKCHSNKRTSNEKI